MLMIPDSVLPSQTRDWKQSLSQSFRCIQDLLQFCDLPDPALIPPSDSGFPIRVTRYYASLIEKGNAQDPLLLQVLNRAAENSLTPGYSTDAVGDQLSMPVPGLIHKYHGRVLLTVTGACAIHCRYCFRRHFPYAENSMDLSAHSPAMLYLKTNSEISEVILSGGDPLMLSDEKLKLLIQQLNHMGHIKRLRIHSRVLSVLPERLTTHLLEILKTFNGQLVMVTHINHPNELSEKNQALFRLLNQAGIRLLNQTVLLKGINDQHQLLITLSYKLFESHIMPYYLHRLDKVQGAAHFDLDTQIACKIYKKMQQSLPGYLLPKMVQEFSGQKSKTAVQCP